MIHKRSWHHCTRNHGFITEVCSLAGASAVFLLQNHCNFLNAS